MFNYRLDIAYDGREFFGSQIQPQKRTVEGELRKQLTKLCKFEDLTFSGRTDSGVHARQQVISFVSDISNEERFKYSLESLLPEDINISKLNKTSRSFNARYSAKSRTYVYFIKKKSKSLPMDRYTALLLDEDLDLMKLNKVTQHFIGENDFLNYSKENNRKNTIRKVTQANWKESNGLYRFAISGESFLWQMVRSIVGSLLAMNNSQIHEKDIKNYLNQKDLGRIRYVAPPQGLYLWKVQY